MQPKRSEARTIWNAVGDVDNGPFKSWIWLRRTFECKKCHVDNAPQHNAAGSAAARTRFL
jgi:hypothetical protein